MKMDGVNLYCIFRVNQKLKDLWDGIGFHETDFIDT